MAACKVVKASMDNSVSKLNEYSGQYKEAATTFISAFKAAIESMEGASKDALLEFFENNIQDFVLNGLPDAVKGLASLLAANAQNFDDTDAQIAASIRGNN